jgi:prepilin-type N-terminal cleavage/methylation domain-containing protein
MKRILAQGFTLVELLIVIALLGVIATIVIAAINPIEQANRATDAGMKADASQMVSAIQRYYVTHNAFPWQVVTPLTYPGADTLFPFISATSKNVGICGTSCSDEGELITSSELQSTFLGKSWITTTDKTGMLYVGHGGSASAGVYVCWVPKSDSDRKNAMANKHDMNLTSGFDTNTFLPVTPSACTPTVSTGWGTISGTLPTCAECVPE